VVIDEVHERSEQSDLLLACVREFMSHDSRLRNLRLVLMSATFDTQRYKSYFLDSELGADGAKLQVIPIPQFLGSLMSGQGSYQTKELYLEHALELIEHGSNHTVAAAIKETGDALGCGGAIDGMREMPNQNACVDATDGAELRELSVLSNEERQMVKQFDAETEESGITPTMHRFVCRLLCRSHAHASNSSTALVFMPTYRALEEQHQILSRLGCFRIFVLHSSCSIEESLRSISADDAATDLTPGEPTLHSAGLSQAHAEGEEDSVLRMIDGSDEEEDGAARSATNTPASNSKAGKPKVILATNVAESSLTIAGVTLVLDLCRRLQVRWDRGRQTTCAEVCSRLFVPRLLPL
jgi:hypothetical protein